ncbi:MAG: FAD-dependent thymidylate synthase [Candidatus Nanopelagicaceae bacterium]
MFTKSKVTYVDHMGEDARAAEAARVSFYKEGLGESEGVNERDAKLIAFLARENHTSPFEHSVLSVQIKCPLFVRSQIMRHRTFSYNEVSRRYTSENLEFFEFEGLRGQASKNLQCSTDDEVEYSYALKSLIAQHHSQSLDLYNRLLDSGVAREQARAVLPQSLMTSFIMTGNVLNWVKFLRLRLDEHTQPECREVAQMCRYILQTHFPHTVDVFGITDRNA